MKQRSWDITKTFLLVTAITLLVWLWAEGENVRSYTLDAEVRFVAPAGQQLIIRPSQSRRIDITVRGNVAKRNEAQELLLQGPIEIDVMADDEQPSVVRTIELLGMLRNSSEFTDRGINIVDVQPARMDVEVEKLVDVSLPVRIESSDIVLAAPPSVDPGTVTVRAPARLIPTTVEHVTVARIDPELVRYLTVNEAHTLDIPVILPDVFSSSSVTVTPPTVKVTLTLRSQTERHLMTTVPNMIKVPVGELGRYRVDWDERHRVLRDVELVGPTDVIDRIRRGEVTVEGVIRLTTDELENASVRDASITVPVSINLPPGVTVANQPAMVNLRIVKLPAPVESSNSTSP